MTNFEFEFDRVVDKAKVFAETAGKKAEKAVEISKLKFRVSQINSEIRKIYEKLGRAVYNMKKANYEDRGLVESVAEEIDELFAEKAAVERKIAFLKSMVVCPVCGAKNARTETFCGKCGSSLSEE